MADLPKGYNPNNPKWGCVVRKCGKEGKMTELRDLTQAGKDRFVLRGPSGRVIGDPNNGQVGLCPKHRAQFLVS